MPKLGTRVLIDKRLNTFHGQGDTRGGAVRAPIDPDFMTLSLCAMYLKDNLTDELQRFIDAVRDCYAEACPG